MLQVKKMYWGWMGVGVGRLVAGVIRALGFRPYSSDVEGNKHFLWLLGLPT